VVKYLSFYVHRIAISNRRIKKLDSNAVSFSYRDSKNQNKQKLKTIPITTFTKRFLLHTLPKNFTRIRHYGFLGTARKRESLALIRELLNQLPKQSCSNIKSRKQSCSKCGSIDLEIYKLRMIPHRNAILKPILRLIPSTAPPA